MKGRIGGALLVAVLAAATRAPLPAQEVRIDLQGGRDHLQQGPVAAGTSSLLLGVRVLGDRTRLGLFGGLPVEEGQNPWGAATLASRLLTPEAPLRVGVDVGVQAFAQGAGEEPDGFLPGGLPGKRPFEPGDPPLLAGWGGTVEAMGVVRARRARFATELRAGASHHHSDFDDRAFNRTLPRVDVEGTFTPRPSVILQADGRRYWDDDVRYARIGVTALVGAEPVVVWGSIGRWLEEAPADATPWGAGIAVDLHRRVALSGSVRHEPFDPLYGTPDRTTWNVGLSFRFNRPAPPRPPVPSRYDDGMATIELAASEAPSGTPRIAGDFNDWTPEGMVRAGDRWTHTVALAPGVYNYAFVAPDGSWFVPESVPGRKPDGFGGWTAVLVVEER